MPSLQCLLACFALVAIDMVFLLLLFLFYCSLTSIHLVLIPLNSVPATPPWIHAQIDLKLQYNVQNGLSARSEIFFRKSDLRYKIDPFHIQPDHLSVTDIERLSAVNQYISDRQ